MNFSLATDKDFQLTKKEIEEDLHDKFPLYIKAEAKVGHKKHDESDHEIYFLDFFYEDEYRNLESMEKRVFVENIDRNLLTLLEYSFNSVDEINLYRIEVSLSNHLDLISHCLNNEAPGYLVDIINYRKNNDRVGILHNCGDGVDIENIPLSSISDIKRYLDCAASKYDLIKHIIK